MSVTYHRGDLPPGLSFGDSVAIDTETMGLKLTRDRLCVVQLSAGDGKAHIVHFPTPDYAAPNLRRVLADPNCLKLFHFGRFDIAMIQRYFDILVTPVYCTKIASRLVRTNSESHSLKTLCSEFLGIDLSKLQQSSDWGAPTLTKQQLDYAASDVLHLHAIKAKLDGLLAREGRLDIAKACFAFLPARAALDLAGWDDVDIFAH